MGAGPQAKGFEPYDGTAHARWAGRRGERRGDYRLVAVDFRALSEGKRRRHREPVPTPEPGMQPAAVMSRPFARAERARELQRGDRWGTRRST